MSTIDRFIDSFHHLLRSPVEASRIIFLPLADPIHNCQFEDLHTSSLGSLARLFPPIVLVSAVVAFVVFDLLLQLEEQSLLLLQSSSKTWEEGNANAFS